MMNEQQKETYILQLLRQQEQQNAVIASLNGALTQAQSALTALTNVVNNLQNPQQNANALDSYLISGGILHKLVHTFRAAVNFSTTILVTGIATFSAAPVLSALTASLPLQLTAGKAITSALISLTAAVTGILPRANGGLGNNAVTPYAGTISGGASAAAGTCSTPLTGVGVGAAGVYAVVAGNVTIPALTSTLSGTTSSDAVTGNTSTNI